MKGLPDGRELFNLEYKDEGFINKFDMPYLKEVELRDQRRKNVNEDLDDTSLTSVQDKEQEKESY